LRQFRDELPARGLSPQQIESWIWRFAPIREKFPEMSPEERSAWFESTARDLETPAAQQKQIKSWAQKNLCRRLRADAPARGMWV
jgi:hypothetical protein